MSSPGRRKLMEGSANPNRKLDANKVREIRALEGVLTQETIAVLFCIGKDAVGRIQRRETWKHVE